MGNFLEREVNKLLRQEVANKFSILLTQLETMERAGQGNEAKFSLKDIKVLADKVVADMVSE